MRACPLATPYQLRPGKNAEQALLDEVERHRFVWNMCVVPRPRTTKRVSIQLGSAWIKSSWNWRGHMTG